MSKFDDYQGRALELAGQIGDGLRHVPEHAEKWFKAGVALGAARIGGSALVRGARRNPGVTVATAVTVAAVGAGLVYAVMRKRKKDAAAAAIEGTSRRIPARPARYSRRAQAAAEAGTEQTQTD